MSASYIHHVVLHFPIALLTVAAVAFVISVAHGWYGWRAAGAVALILGTVAAIVAVVAGLSAEERVVAMGIEEAVVQTHRNAGFITLALAGITTIAWAFFAVRERLYLVGPRVVVAALAVATAASVTATGHFGGTMLHPEIAPVAGVRAVAGVEAEPGVQDDAPAEADLERGAEVYAEECAGCHGPDGRGDPAVDAPPVMGPDALPTEPEPDMDRERRFETGEDVLEYVAETMPVDDPGGLEDEDYREVVRYLLARNGFDVPAELTDEEAATVREGD